MANLWQWGLDFIIFIQQIHGPALDSVFRALTSLGGEAFLFLLMSVVLWCVDFGWGVRLVILLLFSSYLNIDLKDLFRQPRPFDFEPGVQLAAAEGRYGLPSGHSQSAVVVWGYIAARVRKVWLWAAVIGLVILIGFSRVYLGVHFPTDVLAGWAIGAVLLVLYLALQPKLDKYLVRLSLVVQILLALAVSLVLFLVHPVPDTALVLAALAGVGVGLVLAHRYVAFNAGGYLWQRVVRFVVGIAVALALYVGLGIILPGEGSAFYLAGRCLIYGLIGVWITLGGPWLFKLLRLAGQIELS